MAHDSPRIDTRTFEELRSQITKLARQHAPNWQSRDRDDFGMVLTTIYAHYLEILLERLNQVPEKNFLAFLDLMGVGRLSPGAATAPVVFTLAPKAGELGFVPKGTQVATVQTEKQPAVIFETEQDLNVVAAKLMAGYTLDPERDRYADRSAVIRQEEPATFNPFMGDRPLDHILFLGIADEGSLLVQQPGQLLVDYFTPSPLDLDLISDQIRHFDWYRALAKDAPPLDPVPLPLETDNGFRLSFSKFQGPKSAELSALGLAKGLKRQLIQAVLKSPIVKLDEGWAGVPASLPPSSEPIGQPVDFTQTFSPFGDLAVSGSEFWLASRLFFSQENTYIYLFFDLEQNGKISSGSLTWQYWQGSHWADFSPVLDTTDSFQQNGQVCFRRPVELKFGHPDPRVSENFWVRVSPTTVSYTQIPLIKSVHSLRGIQPTKLHLVARTAIQPDEGWAQVTRNSQPTQKVNFTHAFNPFFNAQEFWIASRRGFAVENAHIYLFFDLETIGQPSGSVSLSWQYRDRRNWQPLNRANNQLEDTTNDFTKSGVVSFRRPEAMELRQPNSAVSESYWLRVQPEGNYAEYPTIRCLHILCGIQPDAGATGTTLLDLTKPFYPFGQQPQLNDAFYINSHEAFGQIGARVHILLRFSQPGIPTPGFSADGRTDLVDGTNYPFQLVWEYFSARGWKRLGHTQIPFTYPNQDPNDDTTDFEQGAAVSRGISDSTEGFTQQGEVTFTVPAMIAKTKVAEQESYWVRVRIASGDFGRPIEFVPRDHREGFRPKLDTGNLNPPIIESLTLAYDYQENPIQPVVVTRNGFEYLDDSVAGGTLPHPLFRPVEETDPTLYWGFDRQLPNSAINLYFVMPTRQMVERFSPSDQTAPSTTETQLLWEYWNGQKWVELTVQDETNNFTESGGVQFLGPQDLEAKTLFDESSRYWIRVRLIQADEDYAPLLQGIFLNAVRITQASTIKQEIVGSSSGRKNQTFRLAKVPVLPGQQILIREPESLPAEEVTAIQQEEGQNAVDIREGADGRQEVWVRWHKVESLSSSGTRSRHYTIDSITGEIVFGDGVRGLIPPQGKDNIVCEVYRAGGGSAGNQGAGKITKLKTSIPYITTVTNPLASDGGSDAETLSAVQMRGPQTFKHRDRAVTQEDFEWLAKQAAGTRVARAKCLPNRNRDLQFERGWITVILVPNGPEKKLLPSTELIHTVKNYLAARSLATLTRLAPAHINVIGPGYIPVEIAAEIGPLEFIQADAVRKRALDALEQFFHPLTGGPDQQGWEFGRDVYLSELYAAFENLPGVDYVQSLAFKPTAATLPLIFSDETLPQVRYPPGSTLASTDEELVMVLTEQINPNIPIKSAMIILFQEGEQVEIGQGSDTVRVTIRTISGNTLTIDPFLAQVTYRADDEPKKSDHTPVKSVTSKAQSVLKIRLEAGQLVSQLVVRGLTPEDDTLKLVHPDNSNKILTLTLAKTGTGSTSRLKLGTRLRVPEFALPYSGVHTVNLVQSKRPTARRGGG